METNGVEKFVDWNQRLKIQNEFFSISHFLENRNLECIHKNKKHTINNTSESFITVRKRMIENL